ncbi:lamin tail domain-containing protein 2 [Molossus nigricans]
MAPKSCREAGEAKEEASPPLVDEELLTSHLGPPEDTPADLLGPESLKDTKPRSAQVVSLKLQVDPESLDPRTLRMLWRQRELEIQALRYAVQNPQDARHCHILQEVAGLPPERSSRSQEKVLQAQVQKLTLELKERKEQAQEEKTNLEEELLRTKTLMEQLEAEVQALEKSCLLQLASSSWVGRMLKSSTGSVEVVPAETLMEPSDHSENDEDTAARKVIRLEDVDWNSIARRYPNLFTNIKLSSKHPSPRQPPEPPQRPPASPPNERGSELCKQYMERHIKSVEWCSLPFVGTSSSGDADSDSSSCRLDEQSGMQKATGHPPQGPGHISFQHIDSGARSFSRDRKAETKGLLSLNIRETHSDRRDKIVQLRKSPADSKLWDPAHPWRAGSCLKIVAVSLRDRFVCILNESMEETMDLGGFTLQQFERDFPVCLYRFPPRTLLGPQRHLTVWPAPPAPARPRPSSAPLTRAWRRPQVWGKGPGSTKQQPPSSVGRKPLHFHPSRSFVTLLLSPKGEVFSKHHAPHCVTPVSRIFDDNTNLSIDSFPLSGAQTGADTREQRRPPRSPRNGRVREVRARRRRTGWGPRVPRSPPPPQVPLPPNVPQTPDRTILHFRSPRPRQAGPRVIQVHPQSPTSPGSSPPGPPLSHGRAQALTTPSPHQDAGPVAAPDHQQAPPHAGGASTTPERGARRAWGRGGRGGPAGRGRSDAPHHCPTEDRLRLADCQARNEHRVRVCRKTVDRGCPMVALSVHSRAEKRFGFRFLSCPPITADAGRRV